MKINLMCARVVLANVWVCRCVDTGEKTYTNGFL